MTRRDQRRNDDTTDEESDTAEKNGTTSIQLKPITKSRQMEIYETEESEEEEEDHSNEVIEIDSDDSQDGLDTSHKNDQSSKNEQNNNQDSDRESTSSDIVVVSDDYQKFNEEIERLSKINTEVELNPEDKVSIKNFKIHKLLGTGAYGKVFLVEKLDGLDKGQLYAMKVLEKNKVTQKKKTTEHTRTEREVLEKVINCPFLATLFYAFQTAEKLYLVMEFVQGGELFSHLYRSEHFSEDQVRFYIAEIIVALEQLHRLNIIYRDIKLENILLDADGHIIITDFGLSKELIDNVRAMSYCGTIEYMAPEIVNPNGIGHDLNVDWWSVGVLIIELLSGQSPFSREGEDSNQQLISERIQRQAPNIPATIGKDAKDLILKLLEKDPTKRLGYRRDADELKKHKFFRGIKWDILTEKRYNAPMKPTLKNKFDVSQFSEDFTTQPAEDGPAESGPLTAPNGKNFFKNYSFVTPKLRSNREQSDVKLKLDGMNITDHPPEMNRPSLKEVLKIHKRNKSGFFEKYEFVDDKLPIGDGTYSLCMKCRSIKSREEFAVKILKLSHDASLEIEALKKCQDHKNIVKMVETIQDKRFNYIIFELLSGGELFSRIRDRGSLAENTAHSYFKQIVEAVIFMHSKGIIHKDLKPENILFVDSSADSELRIVDFGFAQKISSDESLPCFTLDYAAPESLVRGETKPSRDLWSLGVILYTMLCGNTPFKPLSNHVNDQDERNLRMQITENIRSGIFNKENIRWNQSSIEARDLIVKLIRVNESERISLDEVLHHPWMLTNFENHSYDASLHRTDSEETIVHEDEEDDAIVINDDDFRNEHRDETRSIDDSSSGIVMSDRNEGSSVSHEDEMVMPMIEEQIEPENLSLKTNEKIEDKLLEDEPTVMVPSKENSLHVENYEELSPVIPKNPLRATKKLRSRANQKVKKAQKLQKSSPLVLHMLQNSIPTGLPLNLVVESEEKFKGYNVMELENDNNFPCFGFSCNSKADITSTIVLLYSQLFDGTRLNEEENASDKKVLSVVKSRRVHKKKILHTQSIINVSKIEVVKMNPMVRPMKFSKVQQKEQIVPKQQSTAKHEKINVPQSSSRPVRVCRVLREAQKVAEIQKLQTKKDEKQPRKRRASKRPKNDQQLVVETKRARKNIDNELPKPSAVFIATQINEEKQPFARKKNDCKKIEVQAVTTRGRKRKIEAEPTAAFEEKEESLKNLRATRRRRQKDEKTEICIKSERLTIKLDIKKESFISNFQRPALNLSPKFKERLNSVRTCYVDNKMQPSIIPSRFTKPEPNEKSAINFYTLQYR